MGCVLQLRKDGSGKISAALNCRRGEIMAFKYSTTTLLIGLCMMVALCAGALVSLEAQQAPAAPRAARGGGGRSGGSAAGLFTAADANKDGFLTRDELKAAFAKWGDGDAAGTGAVTQEQLAAALNAALPQPRRRRRPASTPPQPQTPKPADVANMMAALPDTAPAKPKQPRKVLVLSKAAGFVHSCIPLAAKTVEALGVKTGAGRPRHLRFRLHYRGESQAVRLCSWTAPREPSWTIPMHP